MTPQGLIAYTMIHELDKYNDFDEERVKNLARKYGYTANSISRLHQRSEASD